MSTDLDVVEAELVSDERPGPAAVEPRYLITQHTMLGLGELPPLADQRPAWTDADFRLTAEDVEDLAEPDLSDNMVTNRESTVRAFEEWCAAQDPPRPPYPCTTATYTSYGLHLIRPGKAGEFKPHSVGQYMSRSTTGSLWTCGRTQPFQGPLARVEEDVGGGRRRGRPGRRRHDAGQLRIIAAIDETTNIGKRDAFLAALAYSNLHREMELADQLVKRVKVLDSGLYVTTAMSKTDGAGKGAGRFIKDREDLQLVRRARAWLGVLRELGADAPDNPLFRALTVKGRLVKYKEDRERGLRMRPGSLNERLQVLAERAGVPYIDGRKVTSHSWRAGANTDMAERGVSLSERNKAGRWADGSHTADTVYDRRHGVGTRDPLDGVPLYGGPAHAVVAEARAQQADETEETA